MTAYPVATKVSRFSTIGEIMVAAGAGAGAEAGAGAGVAAAGVAATTGAEFPALNNGFD